MEYIVFTLAIFFALAMIMLKGYLDERRKQKKFAEWLWQNPGVLPKGREYHPEDMERIARYLRAHSGSCFQIDDITWNDLGMDRIFQNMNFTYSAAGEEYLYYLLHTPIQEEKNSSTLENHIRYFMENTDQRVRYQIHFAKIGRTGKHSIYEYLHYLDLLGDRKNLGHYLGILSVVLAFLSMFFVVELGILLVIGTLCRNILVYFKTRKQIDPYLTSFGYILRLLRNAEEMERLPAGAMEEEIEELKACRKKMKRFKAGSYIIMSSMGMGTSGNPLEILLDYLRMAFHLDLIKFNKMLSQVRRNTEAVDRMVSILGYMETVIAIGCYRRAKEEYCIPQFDKERRLEMENAYHPLIEQPVKNSISAQKGVLLTGSNASGKSTFLKTVAVNAILAQTIHTCLADSYRGALYRIMSSMALRDDLEGGDSYYIVEIKSLKRILNQTAEEGQPVLCFVDEVLRGTNTVERIAASTQILKSLAGREVICFAATHDIELTHLLEMYYDNYHFEEEIIEGDVHFNYQLKTGRATTRNAIRLLGVMGYEEKLIQEAETLAENFLREGIWRLPEQAGQ